MINNSSSKLHSSPKRVRVLKERKESEHLVDESLPRKTSKETAKRIDAPNSEAQRKKERERNHIFPIRLKI